MMGNIRILVVIPLYSAQNTVLRAINLVFVQDCNEIIEVINGSSTDLSEQVG